MRKTLIVVAVLLFAAPATAPSLEPSHPLSQIQPVDVDLNMSGKDIGNVTDLEVEGVIQLENGLRIEQNDIRTEGNVEVLVWNDSQSRWEVRNSNVDLNSNSIENFFAGGCGSSEVVTQVYSDGSYNCTSVSSLSTTEDLAQTLSEGNNAGSNSINLSGNNLTSAALVDGVNLSERGAGLGLDTFDRLQIAASGVGSREISSSAIGTGLSGGSGSDLTVDYGSSSTTAARGNTTVDVTPGTALTGGGSLTVGDDSSSVTLGVSQAGITNSLVAFDAVNRSQIGQSGCATDEVLEWDGSSWSCTAVSNLGSDDQDLQYSQGSNPASARAGQEIGITNGANITFQDFYNYNQSLSGTNNTGGNTDEITLSGANTIAIEDNVVDADSNVYNELQTLGIDTTGTNDTISISSNNSVQIHDQYRDGDTDSNNEIQSVQISGDQVTLSQDGSSIYVPFANNSDALDGEEGEFYTQNLSVDSSSRNDVISITNGSDVTIDDDTGADDQDLQYSLASNPAGAVENQEIGITNGANITFQDIYNPNQTISGDQAYNNDTITLSDGSTATVYDRYRDGDTDSTNERQGISTSDDTITIYQTTSEGTSVDSASITDDTGTDDQNLQYSASSISGALTRTQEIGIENGDNITAFEDAYNPNQTISGDQAYNNDTITLSDGSTATVYDRYRDGDTDQNNEIQSVQNDGQQITLSQDGTSIYVTYANNSDTVDSVEASYLNTTISSITNSGQTQTITLSNGDSDTFTDNVDDADADPTNEYQTLSQVLSNGTSAGTNNIDLNGNSVTSSGGEVCIGDQCS